MLAALVKFLRKGDFVNAERLRLIPSALLLGHAIALLVLFASAHGVTDFKGRPLGTDFSNVYAAGHAALHGNATAPFDPPSQYAQEEALFGSTTPFYGWHYPPYFLLIAVPLARLPYLWALAVRNAGALSWRALDAVANPLCRNRARALAAAGDRLSCCLRQSHAWR